MTATDPTSPLAPAPGPATPLEDARAWLRARLEEGEHCPCCTQLAKVYRRKLNGQMVRALLAMYRTHGLDWLHLPTVLNRKQADEAKMTHWGLIQEETEFRRDDGGRAGWWRVTPKGEDFLKGTIVVPKYALIYDARLLRFAGDVVTFEDCLGEPFNYADLMAGV